MPLAGSEGQSLPVIGQEEQQHQRCGRLAISDSAAQLAAEIGISRASLANIEAGRQQVLLHHLFAIADALDLDSPSDLLPAPSPPNADPADLPLPAEGLSETQRQEVLRLMGSVMRNGDQNETEAD